MKRSKLLLVMALLFGSLFMVSCDFFSTSVDNLFNGGFKLPPTIGSNTIDFEITEVGTGFRGYDNFPSITLFVSPTNPDDDSVIANLVEADFFDVIDDNGEARPIEVKAPLVVTSSSNMVDIVFVIDTTGSMSTYISTMQSNAISFANNLSTSDIDYRLGFITFGDEIYKETGKRLVPTSSASDFNAAVGALTVYGGGDDPENQIDAIDYARAGTSELSSNPAGSFQNDMGFLYRDEASKIFILITDMDYHVPGEVSSDVLYIYTGGVSNTVEQEIDKLNDSGVVCYVVAPNYYKDNYLALSTETGGSFFDSTAVEFDVILDTLGTTISTRGDYMITFMSNDFSSSKNHTIRIAVHTSLGDAEAECTYTSPSDVVYSEALLIYKKGLSE